VTVQQADEIVVESPDPRSTAAEKAEFSVWPRRKDSEIEAILAAATAAAPKITLGRESSCPPVASSQAPPDHEIGGQHRDDAFAGSAVDGVRPSVCMVALALFTGCALGWVCGSDPYGMLHPSVPASEKPKSESCSPLAAENQDASSGVRPLSDTSPSGSEGRKPLAGDIHQGPSKPPAPARPTPATGAASPLAEKTVTKPEKISPLAPVPETRPATVPGWIVRQVYKGTAVLEGPGGGVWKVSRGEVVPGLGRVESILMWGGHWIVATRQGLVSSE
jgi:hypothetical protein